ncbi:MAG: Lycopene beta-cyclase [Alphaproteobacteria bacterium]|nr:Lycopene beta-cyclase [Alphaproteobacteria bacterium]
MASPELPRYTLPMPSGRNHGVLIAGGGLSGSLAALAMARLRPEVPILLVGEEAGFGGNRTLLLFDDDLDEAGRDFIAPLIAESWDGYYVAFPGRSRKIRLRCHAITPDRIDSAVRESLRPDQYRTGEKIVGARDQSLLLNGSETIAGVGVLDARAWVHQTTLELGWRKSVARLFRFEAPHRVDRPVLIDTTVTADNAFFSCIPLSADALMVEYIEHSVSPDLDHAAGAARIDEYLNARGWKGREYEREESAVLPVALGGDFGAYWRIGGARVAKLGARGGFFHPTSGSPLPDAIDTALLLTRQRDFAGAALHDCFESHAAALWKRREYLRGFNRLLFRAGSLPHTALDGLYGLDPAVIARFQAGEPGLFDRNKINAATGR